MSTCQDYQSFKLLMRASARVDGLPAYERILKAAEDLLDFGAPNTYTMNEISFHADLGISTLYGCFPGKRDAITRAVANREVERALDRIPDKPEESCSAYDIHSLIGALVTQRLSRPKLTLSLRFEELRLSLSEQARPGEGRLAARFRCCLESADFDDRARKPHAVSEVVAMVEGMIDAACVREDHDADRLSWRITETVLYHLGWYLCDEAVPMSKLGRG